MLNLFRFPRLSRAIERVSGRLPRFDAGGIHDEGFRAHFEYATGVIEQWLAPHIDWKNARVLDFGCGEGQTTLGIALRLAPRELIGLDVHRAWRNLAHHAAPQLSLKRFPGNLRFVTVTPGQFPERIGRFDAICSWSVFEHVEPALFSSIVHHLHRLLRPGGVLFLQIEPLFWSPWGSHLQNLVPEPWAHLLLSHEALRSRVMEYENAVPTELDNGRPLSRSAYLEFRWREYQRLNRYTADQVVDEFRRAGFEILREQRRRLDLQPPAELLERRPIEQLTTNELIFTARKPPA